jgi:CDP-glucose 4,6-dehydratase
MNREFWTDRNVLITGGTGFLGRRLSYFLSMGGANVTVIQRDDDFPGPEDSVKRVAHGDIRDFAFMDRVIGQNEIEIVFHLAAQVIVPIANDNPLSTYEDNVHGTYSVLEACRYNRRYVNRIIVASTDKVYGEMKGGKPYQEGDPLGADAPYDVSKICTDFIARSYAHHFEIPVGITRSGNYYGPGDYNWSRLVPGTIRSIIRGHRPVIRSSGGGLREYFYIDDAVGANVTLAEQLLEHSGEAYNFSSGEAASADYIVNVLLQFMSSDLEPIILGHDHGEIRDQMLDCSKAKKELGWRPTTNLLDGLAKAVEYYKRVLTDDFDY